MAYRHYARTRQNRRAPPRARATRAPSHNRYIRHTPMPPSASNGDRQRLQERAEGAAFLAAITVIRAVRSGGSNGRENSPEHAPSDSRVTATPRSERAAPHESLAQHGAKPQSLAVLVNHHVRSERQFPAGRFDARRSPRLRGTPISRPDESRRERLSYRTHWRRWRGAIRPRATGSDSAENRKIYRPVQRSPGAVFDRASDAFECVRWAFIRRSLQSAATTSWSSINATIRPRAPAKPRAINSPWCSRLQKPRAILTKSANSRTLRFGILCRKLRLPRRQCGRGAMTSIDGAPASAASALPGNGRR